MPKNKGKGGKIRRMGKHLLAKLDMVHKEDGQEYAQVTQMLIGGGRLERLEAVCFNDLKLLCHIPGKLQEKGLINKGDIILVGLRDCENPEADVILKYNVPVYEAGNLKIRGKIQDSIKVTDVITFVDDGLDGDTEYGYKLGDDSANDIGSYVN